MLLGNSDLEPCYTWYHRWSRLSKQNDKVSSLITWFFMQLIMCKICNTYIISHDDDDAIYLQTCFKLPMEVDWLKAHSVRIVVDQHSVWTQTTQSNSLPVCIIFSVNMPWFRTILAYEIKNDKMIWLAMKVIWLAMVV